MIRFQLSKRIDTVSYLKIHLNNGRFILALMLLVCWASGSRSAHPQEVEFVDGKQIELASIGGFLRIKELLRDQAFDEAAKAAVDFAENHVNGFFLVPGETKNDCRLFLRANKFLNLELASWKVAFPKAFEKYREMIDVEAVLMYRSAQQTGNLNSLQQIVDDYFLSEVGDDAANRLAKRYFEAGEFDSAIELWDSLINDQGFPAATLVHYPDSDLSPMDLMASSMFASLFSEDISIADQKFAHLKRNYSNSRFNALGESEMSLQQLESLYNAERLLLGDQSNTMQSDSKQSNSQQSRLQPEKQRPLDIDGRPIWIEPINVFSKSKSPTFGFFPSVADGDSQSIATTASVFRGDAYWCDEDHIYKRSTENVDQKREVVWETLLKNETIEVNRRRIGNPRFEVTISDGKLFARMGDSRTNYRNDSVTRNRSYVIGLDLIRGGRSLPGFPVSIEDVRTEFESKPLFTNGKLYILKRKSYRDNSVSQLFVESLELSPSNRVSKPKSVWVTELGSGNSANQAVADEISNVEIYRFQNRIVVAATGFVTCLNAKTGDVDWIADYPRDRFESKKIFREEAARQRSFCVEKFGKLYVGPTDSDFVFCFDLLTGVNKWKARLNRTAHIMGLTDTHLLVSGDQLFWIDLETGGLSASFPTGSNVGHNSFGLPSPRGLGQGVVTNDLIYWPTRDHVFVFSSQMTGANSPALLKIIDLKMRQVTGGNLTIAEGIMLIATEDRLLAFGE